MNLRQVEVFQAVMQTGSMSAAGRLIHLSQPAVSRIISSAEASLGYALFQRTGGRLAPTQEGLVLFEASTALLEKMQAFTRVSSQLRGGDKGRLSISAIPAICHRLLPWVIAEFRRSHPDVVCEVHVLHKRQIVEDLLGGGVDMGFDFYGISHPGIDSRVLGTGPLYVQLPVAMLPRKIAGAEADSWLRAFMTRTPMIALVDADPIAIAFTQYCDRIGLQISSRTQVQTSELAEELVSAGLGWTVTDFISAVTSREGVAAWPLQPLMTCTLNSFVVRGGSPSLVARKFAALVQSRVSDLAARKAP
ncbi:LysR family transcriptional regulator [Ramlibacter sp. WS9]|uniref:LysR family transcriptional regulator n=1 Tax=Ramlibacter sp. WS9 TaxID=1882741 RepID=UPI00114404D6|nr:LysR family transcriptional regulator [Ramlibacter sp. WS9]ROZ69612.1 LysR family transcriptional regulator [Ramlibacter sp. WS9]